MNQEAGRQLPALAQFMGCYWMETADLVYGNLTGATRAFLAIEAPSVPLGLLNDLAAIRAAGYLVSRPAPGSDKERFWRQFGARWLSEEDAELIISLIRRRDGSR